METQKVIAILECAGGNESVGTMWYETKIFELFTPISEIFKWKEKYSSVNTGKLSLTLNNN